MAALIPMPVSLVRVQARFSEVESILGRAPSLRLNEIALLGIKFGGRDLMSTDEGGLRWVTAKELQAYIAACREALAAGEALLEGLSHRENQTETTAG